MSTPTSPENPAPCPQPGTFGWNELYATDLPQAQEFYTRLFGWNAQPFTGGEHEYTIFNAGDRMAGGMMKVMQPGSPAYWLSYVLVSDCAASAKRVVELGGTLCLPPKEIAGVGYIAIFSDPQGATLGLFQPAAK